MSGFIDWAFRHRRTGEITIGQTPNPALWVFAVASAIGWLGRPEGRVGEDVRLVATASLAVWALDELARGVNPWRRFLGATVLIYLIVSRWL